MNERIKELAGQTGIIDVELLNDSQSKMLKKFAELIMRECMEINLTLLGHNTCKNLHNLYEEHLGVEDVCGRDDRGAPFEDGESALIDKVRAQIAAIAAPTPQAKPAHAQELVEMSPEFTDTARSALLWVLWHHQGGSSPVGQPIRFALGMDAHERLSAKNIEEAKRWAKQTASTTAEFHPTPPAAQQERGEPVGEIIDATDGAFKCVFNKALPIGAKLYTTPKPKQEQGEPVAVKHMMEWVDYLKRKSDYGQHMRIPSEMSAGACWELAVELEQFINTTPQQRTWVGLTSAEWSDLYEAHHDKYNQPKQGNPDGMDYERAIEAKLKEKNT